MASYNDLRLDWEILLDSMKMSKNINNDLQLAAELGKTLLERNKELENLLRAHQRKCEDQKQEIEFLTKQNLALKEVNDTRMQIYESLDISIHDLEREKHQLIIENSFNKKHIKELNETLEKLEQRCDEATKQFEDVRHILEQERRRNEKVQEGSSSHNSSHRSSNNTSINNDLDESVIKATIVNKESTMRHIGSASEPENDEASTPTNPSKSFTTSGQMSISQTTTPFMNYSQEFSSIQPIYSQDSESHDSGFKASSSSSGGNCADHEELLRVLTELEETKQQAHSAQLTISELEQQLSVLSHENSVLQNRIVQSNTLDEMKSVHEELSFLEEVRQGQMCTRCLKTYDDRMTDNTSYIGTENEDEDRSLLDLLNEANTDTLPPVYRLAVSIKACPICTYSRNLQLAKKLHELPLNLSIFSIITFELWLHIEKLSCIRWIIKLLQWPAVLICRLINLDDMNFDNIKFM